MSFSTVFNSLVNYNDILCMKTAVSVYYICGLWLMVFIIIYHMEVIARFLSVYFAFNSLSPLSFEQNHLQETQYNTTKQYANYMTLWKNVTFIYTSVDYWIEVKQKTIIYWEFARSSSSIKIISFFFPKKGHSVFKVK